MKTWMLRLWAGAVAGILLSASVPVFSQSDQAAPAKPKASSKRIKSKTAGSATVHRSSKSGSSKSGTVSRRKTSAKTKAARSKNWRRGQQKVDSARAREIQDALIREHYLSGSPSGKWDGTTEDALRRYQTENGWQDKTVPDSRALIKLGLGPNHDHLLNPESAMTTPPETPRTSAAPKTDPHPVPAPATSPNQPQR